MTAPAFNNMQYDGSGVASNLIDGDNPLPISPSDSASVDAFGRWRVSNTETLFDSKQLYDAQPNFWDDQEVSGSGTSSSHSIVKAATTMSVSNATAGLRLRQTYMRFNYQPGKSQRILMTCNNLNTSTGITKGFGYGDDNNGLFLISEEGTIKFIRRTSTSGSLQDNETEVSILTSDGTEADLSKTMIMDIDFEWLGVGRVRAGYVEGVNVTYFYTFVGVNNLNVVYMSTPNLPLRYWIENDGNGAADSFDHICSSVMSEGGLQNNGLIFSASTGSSFVNANTIGTYYALIGIRPKTTCISANIKSVVESILAATSDNFLWELRFNPTVAGTFTYNDKSNSCVQIAIGDTTNNPSTNTVSGGEAIRCGYASGNSFEMGEIFSARHLGTSISGTRDTFVLCVCPLGSNLDVYGSLTWRELV